MQRLLCAMLLTLTASPAAAQVYAAPYAEDVLREAHEAENAMQPQACPQVVLSGQTTLTTTEANALLCMAKNQLPLALSVPEYGCADRAEIIIGSLLQTGLDFDALGRISTFYDTSKHADKTVFAVNDPNHGEAFYRAWQLTFGTDFARSILLSKNKETLKLDVDGDIRWNIGHIAPTIWVRDEASAEPQLRVFDPMLSSDQVLTPEQWRAAQNAQKAALVWGKIDEAPTLMVEHLPTEQMMMLKRENHQADNAEVDTEMLDHMLRNLPTDIRIQMEAKVLGIGDKAAWHPRNWDAYSFVGGLTTAGGGDALPPFQKGNMQIAQARINAALANMELILAYDAMRKAQPDEEVFLQEVKTQLLKRKKKPEQVILYFDE